MAEKTKALISKENTEVKFNMNLDQRDLIEVAVADQEEKLRGEVDVVRKSIKNLNKEIEDTHKSISKEEVKLLEAVKKTEKAAMLAAFKGFYKNLDSTTGVQGRQEVKKVLMVYGAFTIFEERDSKRLGYGNNQNLFSCPLQAKASKLILDGEKRLEAIEKELQKLRNDEYDIVEKLSDVDRLLRQARAKITKKALGDNASY